MPEYIRNYVPGGTYFFTLVSFDRMPIWREEPVRKFLRVAMNSERQKRHFNTIAIVLLPDHFHVVWALPRGDSDYSQRLRSIKSEFTEEYLKAGGIEGHRNRSRRNKNERAVWQRRFWEHTVCDEEDLERCVDYIHWNPVKHGYVNRVRDWPHSSFHRFVREGHYDINWGSSDPTPGYDDPEWGEAV